MVFFTCNHCGESLKKGAVEKHYQWKSCRNAPIFLTCVDCLKDFKESEYVAHIKCITEAERYSAKGYVAKPDKNKGAQKQEIWTECIEDLASKPGLDYATKSILERIAAQSNAPRKKPKFINFLNNSMRFNVKRAEEIWKIIEEGLEQFKVKAPSSSTSQPKPNEMDSEAVDKNLDITAKLEENRSNGDTPKANNLNIETVITHALAQPNLKKSTKKTLKKLLKQIDDVPLNVQRPKKKKFIKFLQTTIELDESKSDLVWGTISASINAIAFELNGTACNDLSHLNGIQENETTENGFAVNGSSILKNRRSKKRTNSECAETVGKKKRKITNGE